MAEVERRKRTRAQEIISERLRARDDGTVDHPWPNGAHLIAADEDWAGSAVLRAARAGDPAVLFFPDGEEIVLTPSKPAQPDAASR
jgi:hypothetical protein